MKRLLFLFIESLLIFQLVSSQCTDCKDRTVSPGCPEPGFCGFLPIICTNCSDPAPTPSPSCTSRTWCKGVTCNNCMDGMPMDGCPDPGSCGFKPIQCIGCVPGLKQPKCPRPQWCGNFSAGTPPCYNCMAGMAMKDCPDPGVCGLPPLCIDCMQGMSMPNCPRPEACSTPPLCTNCTEGKSTATCPDPGLCGMDPLCENCMAGMAMPLCPRPDACNTNCVMNMYFLISSDTCILLEKWHVTNSKQWVVAILFIILICFLREFLSVYRNFIIKLRHRKIKKKKNSVLTQQQPLLEKNEPEAYSPLLTQAIDSLFYLVSVFVSYIIMLLIMTYNVGIFVTIILACGFGHFIFSYSFSLHYRKLLKEAQEQDKNNSSLVNREEPNYVYKNEAAITTATNADHCCDDIQFDD